MNKIIKMSAAADQNVPSLNISLSDLKKAVKEGKQVWVTVPTGNVSRTCLTRVDRITTP